MQHNTQFHTTLWIDNQPLQNHKLKCHTAPHTLLRIYSWIIFFKTLSLRQFSSGQDEKSIVSQLHAIVELAWDEEWDKDLMVVLDFELLSNMILGKFLMEVCIARVFNSAIQYLVSRLEPSATKCSWHPHIFPKVTKSSSQPQVEASHNTSEVSLSHHSTTKTVSAKLILTITEWKGCSVSAILHNCLGCEGFCHTCEGATEIIRWGINLR